MSVRPVPLPDNLPPHLGLSNKTVGIRRAYSTLLKIQKSISSSIGTRGSREQQRSKLMRVRILGYLILKGPSLTASEFVAEEVNSYEDDEDQIDKIGEMFFLHYLCIFRKYGGRTPASSRSSCNAFETRKEMMIKMLREADQPPQNYREAKRLALVRDNFQCVVSGSYDSDSVVTNDELEAKVLSEDLPMGITHCAHIFPDSINRNISDSKDEVCCHNHHAASIWAILGCFGYEDLPKRLKGSGIHALDNVMTLDSACHHWFDKLLLWFEAEGSPDTYTVKATKEITLTTDSDLPLLDPAYLEIHAACCRVAHLSGAGEYMDEVLEDLEDTRVLSEDGSSAHLLSFVLQQEVIASCTAMSTDSTRRTLTS
ncbi:hypothetical protein EDB89DRAFT_1856482 [Lactarius sanguifluus]|nr:hypothetical protein EDB89DRAFT_1856482 [Lactarius sanguifluus]